jgi:hypothetical protein
MRCLAGSKSVIADFLFGRHRYRRPGDTTIVSAGSVIPGREGTSEPQVPDCIVET